MIRIATKEDLPEVSELWKKMVLESRKDWDPNTGQWQQYAVSLMDTGVYYLVIYELDDNIVGFIDGMVFGEPSTGKPHGVAQHFYILPEHRGTEISGKLYEEILYLAVKNKAEVLELFCFPEMRTYWEKKGFREERTLMRRQIDV